MTSAPPRPNVSACRQCAGRPATVLQTISASRHDNTRIADHLAAELGDGAHTHAARKATCAWSAPPEPDRDRPPRPLPPLHRN